MNADFYTTPKTCPACERRFNLVRPKTSACPVISRDTDFRIQYGRTDANLYSVWVCPHCGYAASEATFEPLEAKERQVVRDALQERRIPPGTDGERTPEAAIAAYEQAIHLATLRRLGPSSLAGLHLKLGWIYRGLGETEKELAHLSSARDCYLSAFNSERLGGPGKMSETSVAYLVGELSRRTGDFATAITWFSRLVSDPRAKAEPQIVNLAREQWHQARVQATGAGAGSAGSAPPVETAPAAKVSAAAKAQPEAAAPPAEAPPVHAPHPERGTVPPSRHREGKISSMIPLYRDQVEWLQKLVSQTPDSRLVLADAVRAILDLVILNVPTERLSAGTEQQLREKLNSLFRQADGE